ncbi:MAG TPA: DUF805 domain-containing protein [Allosphingosinicella sp.]|jgi:uncharacterized membrane protein YhaH (DUF805 family)
MHWMLMPLRRYADFSGRSRRMEFWMWQLGKVIFFGVLFILALAMMGPALMSGDVNNLGSAFIGIMFLYLIYLVVGLAILVPDLAVAVRRLHDTERSGWWILAPLAPYIPLMALGGFAGATLDPKNPTGGAMAGLGILAMVCILAVMVLAIVLLVFYFLEGTPGPNKYGPDPKANTGQVFT